MAMKDAQEIQPFKVLIAEDSLAQQLGFRTILHECFPNLEEQDIMLASTLDETVKCVRALADLCLDNPANRHAIAIFLDIVFENEAHEPGERPRTGINILPDIWSLLPGARVVIVSSSIAEDHVRTWARTIKAMQQGSKKHAGAWGWIQKGKLGDKDLVKQAVATVLSGKPFRDADIQDIQDRPELDAKEVEALLGAGIGLTDAATATRTKKKNRPDESVGDRAIQVRIKNAYEKLSDGDAESDIYSVRSRAVFLALQRGVITLEDLIAANEQINSSLDTFESSVDDTKIKIESKAAERKGAKLDKRILELEDALKVKQEKLGRDEPALEGDICLLAAQYYARSGIDSDAGKAKEDLQKAYELFLQAESMQAKFYDEQHGSLVNTFVYLGNCARDLKKMKEAERYFQLAKEIVERHERAAKPLSDRGFFFESYAEWLKRRSQYEAADYYQSLAKKPAAEFYQSYEDHQHKISTRFSEKKQGH